MTYGDIVNTLDCSQGSVEISVNVGALVGQNLWYVTCIGGERVVGNYDNSVLAHFDC